MWCAPIGQAEHVAQVPVLLAEAGICGRAWGIPPRRQQDANLLVQGPQAVLHDKLSQLRDLFDAEEPGLSAGCICTRIWPDGGDGVLVVVGEDGDALDRARHVSSPRAPEGELIERLLKGLHDLLVDEELPHLSLLPRHGVEQALDSAERPELVRALLGPLIVGRWLWASPVLQVLIGCLSISPRARRQREQ